MTRTLNQVAGGKYTKEDYKIKYDDEIYTFKVGVDIVDDGDILINFIIEFLKTKEKQYNIDMVLLTDNSYLLYNKCDDTVTSARLKMITHGMLRYMKYGFEPHNSEKEFL